MKLGVLGSSSSWYFQDLQRAAAAQNVEAVAVPFTSLSAGLGAMTPWFRAEEESSLLDFDAMLVRSMPPGSLEQIVFRMNALHRLEAAGVRVVNPARTLEIAIDKYLTSALLAEAGLATPDTIVCQTVDDAMQAFHELGKDVVVKPLFGSEGRGITRITEEAVAWRTCKALVGIQAVLYLQRFVPNPGFDFRLLLVGNKLFGVRRQTHGDWRTNVSLGARVESLEITPQLEQMARKSQDATQAPIVAVDVLPGDDGVFYVLEVNAVPGWRGLAKCLQIDIAAEVVSYAMPG